MRKFMHVKAVRLRPPLLPWFSWVSGFIVCISGSGKQNQTKAFLFHLVLKCSVIKNNSKILTSFTCFFLLYSKKKRCFEIVLKKGLQGAVVVVTVNKMYV